MHAFFTGLVFLGILAWLGALILKPFGLVSLSWAQLLSPIAAFFVFIFVSLSAFVL